MRAEPRGDADRRAALLREAGLLFESFSYDRAETLERFLRIAGRVAPFDRFALVTMREEGGVEITASGELGLPGRADPSALRIEDFQPSVGDGGLRFVVDEVDAETANPLFPPGGPVRSFVTIPLAATSRAVGTLLLGSFRPRAFRAEDMDLYFTIGSQLAVALENIRFHREAREQVESLTALHQSEIALARITDLPAIEEGIARTAVETLGAASSVLYLVEGEGEDLRLVPRATQPADAAPAGPVRLGRSEIRLLAAGGVVDWAEGLVSPPSYRPARARSTLAFPFFDAARPTALLVVGGRHPQSFPARRRSLFELFAAHAASIHANACLYARLGARTEELERSNLLNQQYSETLKETNVSLERRLYELSTLYEVVSKSAGAPDLDTVLRFILDRACVVMSAEKGSFLLTEGDRLRVKVARGIDAAESLEFRPGEGVAGWVALHGHPKIVEDTTREPRFVRRGTGPDRAETLLCVPLKSHEKVIGVLNVDRDLRYGAFTPEEARLLTTLASAAEGTIERTMLLEDLSAIVDEVLEAFAAAVEARDKYTYGHSKRVRALAIAIAKRLRLSAEEIETIARAALLHDIGKIGIPDEILLKRAPLTSTEYELMKEHVVFGERIVQRVRRMAEVARIVRHHHEWWDGSGYPDGLAGDRIPLGSAIIGVADAYDTIVTDRPYRPARPRGEAIQEVARCGGRQFHPLVVGAFLSLAVRTPSSKEEGASADEVALPDVEKALEGESGKREGGGLAAVS